MTRDQDTEWRQAILPVTQGILEDHKPFREGLFESRQRLEDWNVPGWAEHLRVSLLSWGSDRIEPWHVEFAIRSETALVGIQIIHPFDATLYQIYQRIFVCFLTEALRPFVEWVNAHGEYHQAGYAPMLRLFELCERFQPPADSSEWYLEELMPTDSERYSLPEFTHAKEMLVELLRVARSIFNPKPKMSWWSADVSGLDSLVAHLNRQHQWHLEGKPGTDLNNGTDHTELIANAYLTVLEAECPPPNWA